jgi:hypothetical protein
LHQVLKEYAVFASEQSLIDYWGQLTVAGFLLMPPTLHNLINLNEAMKIKRKIILKGRRSYAKLKKSSCISLF